LPPPVQNALTITSPGSHQAEGLSGATKRRPGMPAGAAVGWRD
jgi:hypothetical protein